MSRPQFFRIKAPLRIISESGVILSEECHPPDSSDWQRKAKQGNGNVPSIFSVGRMEGTLPFPEATALKTKDKHPAIRIGCKEHAFSYYNTGPEMRA